MFRIRHPITTVSTSCELELLIPVPEKTDFVAIGNDRVDWTLWQVYVTSLRNGKQVSGFWERVRDVHDPMYSVV